MIFAAKDDLGQPTEIMSSPDLSPAAIRQERAREMLRRKLLGWNNQQIARFLGCTDRWVRAEVSGLPIEEQRRVVREVRAIREALYAESEIGMAV